MGNIVATVEHLRIGDYFHGLVTSAGLAEGKPNKLIARQLDMQENTVKVHVRNILRKLNAANRTHAAFVANRLLGQDAECVALPTSPRPFDRAHSPNLAARGMTDAACGRAETPSVYDQSAAD